jgi:hypothetical protein
VEEGSAIERSDAPPGVPAEEWLLWKQEFETAYLEYQRTRFKAVYLLWEGIQRFGDYVFQVIAELGVTEHTLENWLRVAKYIPQEFYHPNLSFSHHVLVAQKSIPLAKRVEYLDWAEETGANYVELKEYIKQDRGEKKTQEITKGEIEDWIVIAYLYLTKASKILEEYEEHKALAEDIGKHLRLAMRFPFLQRLKGEE